MIILATIQPASASALVTTIAGVDTIMMVNVGTYLINSLGEKYIYSDRFVMQWIKTGGWKTLVGKVSAWTGNEENEEGNG